MNRPSTIHTKQDQAGEYEIEVFDHAIPKRVIVCAHGNGVRRWDGEEFFYAVAEHYADSAVLLVDQNQVEGNGIRLNSMQVMTERINGIIEQAKAQYPDVPIVVIAHSMGCTVASQADTDGLSAIVLVTPAAGKPYESAIERYGQDIVNGKTITSSDGLVKVYSPEFMESIKGTDREETYRRLVSRFHPVYVFEAERDEIIGPERFAHRDIAFDKYFIVPGARHNLAGEPLQAFFAQLDPLL